MTSEPTVKVNLSWSWWLWSAFALLRALAATKLVSNVTVYKLGKWIIAKTMKVKV